MKKIDIEEAVKHEAAGTKDDYLPLLSQNISIVEVGAYSQIFDQFIDFLGIRTLVITDLDATKEVVNDKGKRVRCSCPVAEGESYSNEAISHFFNRPLRKIDILIFIDCFVPRNDVYSSVIAV